MILSTSTRSAVAVASSSPPSTWPTSAQRQAAERLAVQRRVEQPRAARVLGSSDATAGSAAPHHAPHQIGELVKKARQPWTKA
jgi:hypothetical protein